jgi:hypothetical protein
MSPALTPVRDKVHAVEVARPEPGPGNFCLTPTIEAEATQVAIAPSLIA